MRLMNEVQLMRTTDEDGGVRAGGDGSGHEGWVGGHIEDGVLTIPWVISQLSMGSS